tara:strand:- start:68 stop:427 length:360 start_codon:yes stop_codon:yes gene_type:complete
LPRKVDLSIIGEEFGYLTVVGLSEKRPEKGTDTLWDCHCSICGNTKPIRRSNIVSGNTNSCGCRSGLNKKVAKLARTNESTVSVIMNNKWQIARYSIEMVERVKKAAKSLNYKPWYRRF